MPESTPTYKKSIEELRGQLEILIQTEGWKKLTEHQKKIIQETLTAIPKKDIASLPNKRDWYCHAAVWALEHEINPQEELSPHLDTIEESFYDGEYSTPISLDDIRAVIQKVGFPAVVHIAGEPPPLTLLQVHTFLALGINTDGEVVGWEKESEHASFRYVTLSQNYRMYTAGERIKPYVWGVRALRNNSTE